MSSSQLSLFNTQYNHSLLLQVELFLSSNEHCLVLHNLLYPQHIITTLHKQRFPVVLLENITQAINNDGIFADQNTIYTFLTALLLSAPKVICLPDLHSILSSTNLPQQAVEYSLCSFIDAATSTNQTKIIFTTSLPRITTKTPDLQSRLATATVYNCQ
jgi:hypothetical protein